jgi:hypothetical protein
VEPFFVSGYRWYQQTNDRLWHRTDMPTLLSDVRCWVNSGKHLLAASISHFDPSRALALAWRLRTDMLCRALGGSRGTPVQRGAYNGRLCFMDKHRAFA